MKNVLLEKPDYRIEQTARGVWRHFVYESGRGFHEFKSYANFNGLPLIHYVSGICPETGRHVTAKGVIAIGRVAMGLIAIGQASIGVIAIGQLAIGLLFGLGQLTCGIASIGQVAIALAFGFGQVTTGYIAIGQIAYGKYVLAQFGFGEHVLSMLRKDQQAIDFFKTLPILKDFIH